MKAGDTCESIAVANSVAQGTLWAINNLSPDCSAMTVGQSLCLPKQCDLYTLERNDTCWSIASAKGLSFSSILGYNPTISPDCSNLNATGSVICVSNPQGNFAPPPVEWDQSERSEPVCYCRCSRAWANSIRNHGPVRRLLPGASRRHMPAYLVGRRSER